MQGQLSGFPSFGMTREYRIPVDRAERPHPTLHGPSSAMCQHSSAVWDNSTSDQSNMYVNQHYSVTVLTGNVQHAQKHLACSNTVPCHHTDVVSHSIHQRQPCDIPNELQICRPTECHHCAIDCDLRLRCNPMVTERKQQQITERKHHREVFA